MTDARLVVLASGTGTLLQAILDSRVSGCVAAVGSDLASAPALARAESAGIATFVAPMLGDRAEWDRQLLANIDRCSPDWIVSAGFMRIMGSAVLDRYSHRILNTHPSLLPSFPGAHAVRDALTYGVKVTGCTVHLVDSGVDTGPIVAQQSVLIHDRDDETSLHERIKQVERVLLVDVLERLVEHGLEVDGRSVTFR